MQLGNFFNVILIVLIVFKNMFYGTSIYILRCIALLNYTMHLENIFALELLNIILSSISRPCNKNLFY